MNTTNTDNFCERYEMPWKDVPVHIHELPNGTLVKYGYCRTQSFKEPDRELWFVSFKQTSFLGHASTFVVDKLCTQPDFLNRMGDDMMKWQVICFCRLDEGNEVHFDDLKTGTLEGGYVRSNSFSLDSPYLPFLTNDVIIRTEKYEEYFDREQDKYESQSRGLFSKLSKFEKLSELEKTKLLGKWATKAARQILRDHQKDPKHRPGLFDQADY
jgi:hypothetical protein